MRKSSSVKKGQDFALLLGSELVPSPRARSSTGLGLAGGARMLSLSVKPRGETGDLAVVEGSSSPFVLLREGFCALVLLPGSSCSSKMSLCHCSSWRFFSASKTSWLLSSSLTGKKKPTQKKGSSAHLCHVSVTVKSASVLNPASSCRAPHRRGRIFRASKGRNPSEIGIRRHLLNMQKRIKLMSTVGNNGFVNGGCSDPLILALCVNSPLRRAGKLQIAEQREILYYRNNKLHFFRHSGKAWKANSL